MDVRGRPPFQGRGGRDTPAPTRVDSSALVLQPLAFLRRLETTTQALASGGGRGGGCGGGGSALPPAGLAASHPPRRFHGKVPQQPPGRGTLMGARCPGDSAPPRGGCAHVGSRRAGSVFRGSTIPSDYFIVPTNFRATQIRQKLPGQTGCDPTFPLLPESVGPVSLTRV